MADPKDGLWSTKTLETLNEVYFGERGNYESGNITLRTVAKMPAKLHDETKMIFFEIAEFCTLFNASHKVNFEEAELPQWSGDARLAASKKKGFFTYATPPASLYQKTSLTFDYWVPKILEWVGEIRAKGLSNWRGEAILAHESCTDFMRIALLFLADPEKSPPVAKQTDRQQLVEQVFGAPFVWIKKTQKREAIVENNKTIVEGLKRSASASELEIPLEAWCRILPLPFVKSLLGS